MPTIVCQICQVMGALPLLGCLPLWAAYRRGVESIKFIIFFCTQSFWLMRIMADPSASPKPMPKTGGQWVECWLWLPVPGAALFPKAPSPYPRLAPLRQSAEQLLQRFRRIGVKAKQQ